MALKRFQTNGRLWFWISLVLFIIPWFVPFGDYFPILLFYILFAFPSHIFETTVFIGFYCLLFGIPAMAVGWLVQCVVVMIRDSRRL
jgi:hypothetical protein